MHSLFTFRSLLLAVVACLLAGAARAQYNPAASPLVMASLVPVTNLNAVPEPAELASFYDPTHKDLQPALRWMQEVNGALPTYWTLYAEARIQLALGHYREAAEVAGRAERLAQVAAPANSPYRHLSADALSDARRLLATTGPADTELASVGSPK